MVKKIILLVLSLLWIGITLFPITIFTNAGTLFTYSTGLFSLQSPEKAGEVSMADAGQNVEIYIDSVGVPHIYGDKATDVVYGLGYMHARDRYFQMELITRMVQGALGDVLGGMVEESDKFWLGYSFEVKAKEIYEELKTTQPDVYAQLNSYSAGINYYLQSEKSNFRSPEYVLLGSKPRAWEPHYPILLLWYMSHTLTYSEDHIARQNVVSQLAATDLIQLYTTFEDSSYSYIVPDSVFNFTDSSKVEELNGPVTSTNAMSYIEKELKKSLGSNNWSVAASKSANGNSMLCNDPHLDLSLPGPWYEARLFCKEYNTSGFTIPCSPWVISGHNNSIAWGVTNGEWDLLDRILLTTNDKNQYNVNGEWKEFEKRQITLSVKGKAKPTEQLFTVWGPVNEEGGKKYALRWYPEEKHISLVTFDKLARATNWTEFNEALSIYKFPPQNFIYADKDGNVGLKCAGNLPYKPKTFKGGVITGNVPVKPVYVPYDKLPGYFQPARGFASSANQIPAKTTYYANYEWPENYRGKRINQFLASKSKISIEDMMALQYDKKDISLDRFKLLMAEIPTDTKGIELLNPLKEWNGVIDSNKYEPILYFAFKFMLQHNLGNIVKRQMNIKDTPRYSNVMEYISGKDTLTIGDTVFTTKAYYEMCLNNTVKILEKDFGKDYVTKGNANYHSTFDLKHLLKLPGWGTVAPNAAGNNNTPNVITNRKHGASMRTAIIMSSPVEAYTIQAGGQSGRVNSLNYMNQVGTWTKGKYKKEQLSAAADLKGIVTTIKMKKK